MEWRKRPDLEILFARIPMPSRFTNGHGRIIELAIHQYGGLEMTGWSWDRAPE